MNVGNSGESRSRKRKEEFLCRGVRTNTWLVGFSSWPFSLFPSKRYSSWLSLNLTPTSSVRTLRNASHKILGRDGTNMKYCRRLVQGDQHPMARWVDCQSFHKEFLLTADNRSGYDSQVSLDAMERIASVLMRLQGQANLAPGEVPLPGESYVVMWGENAEVCLPGCPCLRVRDLR